MNELRCKVLVIGGGPGGYVAAIRAGQLGLDTVLVEDDRLGGTCLNVGCIPSKALIHAAGRDAWPAATRSALDAIGLSVGPPSLDFARTIAWKDRHRHAAHRRRRRAAQEGQSPELARAGARSSTARPRSSAPTRATRASRAEHLVLATGSEPVELPALPFGGDILSSTEALALTEVPRSLAVVGAGYIGMELGMAFAKLGAKVTIVEALPRILPLYDAELTQPRRPPPRRAWRSRRWSGRQGDRPTPTARLRIAAADGAERAIPADKVLVAVGRRAAHGRASASKRSIST